MPVGNPHRPHPPPWVFPPFHPSWKIEGPLPPSPYLGREHVRQAVGGSVEREAPDQVDDEHTVGQQRGKIHHLRAPEGRVSVLETRCRQCPSCPCDRPEGLTKHHTITRPAGKASVRGGWV